MECALAFIIAGDEVAGAGLPISEEVARDPTVCQLLGTRGPTASPPAYPKRRPWTYYQQQLHQRHSLHRLPCLVLENVVAASARRNLPSLLEQLPQPQRPIASALLEQLRTVATEVKKSQIEDTVGSSWAALAMEEDPQERRIGTLLVEAGAGGGGGRGRGESGGRAGILNSENNGRNRWQLSLIGRTS